MRNKEKNNNKQMLKAASVKNLKLKVKVGIGFIFFLIISYILMQTNLINIHGTRTKESGASVDEVPITTVEEDNDEQLYINTNVFKYNYAQFNAETEKIENGVEGIYFTGAGTSYNETAQERYNKWVREESKIPCQEIVANELTADGNIQFNYPEAGIFTQDEVNGKKIYNNVIPFWIKRFKIFFIPNGIYYIN